MVLLKDEYEVMKKEFLNIHNDYLVDLIKKKKESFIESSLHYVTLGEFIRNYGGVTIVSLFLLCAAWVENAITFDMFITFTIILFIIHAYIFNTWKKDMKNSALEKFSFRYHMYISDFVYKKMCEDVSNSFVGVDFEKKVQFYSIAIYDIPKTFHIDVYRI